MKIFVLHYSKLVDRKAFIVEQFKKHAIVEYEFIEQYNKEDLKQEDVMIFDTSVNPSTMSLINKHIYAYMEVAAKYEYALILEDDVILSDNFMNTLTMYMTQLPNDFDMLFIGDGCNLHIEKDVIVANQYIYEKCLYPTKWGGNGATRCTDSYVISNKCAKTICSYIVTLPYKIKLSIDWWLNMVATDNHLKVYWAEPTIVTQGSENDLFVKSY